MPFALYEGQPHDFAHTEVIHLNFIAKSPNNKKHVCFNPNYYESKADLSKFKYVGSNDFERKYTIECINEVIKAAKENGFIVIYNHPAWSLNTYSVYSRLENLNGLEIVNGAAHRASDTDYTPHIYDDMLRCGKRLICVGGDDNHDTRHFFKAWTMIKATSLTYENLTENLEKGNCYASSGPEIFELFIEDGNVVIRCSEAAGIYYSTAGRRNGYVLAEGNVPFVTEGVFKINPEDIFFRISVKDAKGNHANTRAYFLNELI